MRFVWFIINSYHFMNNINRSVSAIGMECVYSEVSSKSLNKGLFITPSGISELECATTKTDAAERSISIGRESLQVFCTRDLGILPRSTAMG